MRRSRLSRAPRVFRLSLAASLVALVFGSVLHAADAPNPQDDMKSLELADGFEVSLYAADPAIAKPVQMNFDSKGRLWVASSESYPQLEPAAEPNDKIFIVEDTDGDGKADKSSVFADGLLMPTGLEPGDGGVYVGQSTELLHLKDTDGDGKADQTRVVLSGFGTEDTHHLIHTLRWGPEGLLYFAQSIYIHSHIETPWGVRRLNGGGFWTLRPETTRLDVFVHGMVNSWGIAFDDHGEAFGVDNDTHSPLKFFLPGARFAYTPGEKHILEGIVLDKPKYCGTEMVTSPQYPDAWQGDLLTCDFRAHRVCRYKLDPAGAGFSGAELQPLVSSKNVAFRPIDLKFGPDGALYICDWYNPIINHGEVDFRDPRRDKTHGRIWRVTAKGRPAAKWPDFAKASVVDLLEMQKSKDGQVHHFARRTLAERPKYATLNRLATWAPKQTNETVLLRALWIYQALDYPNKDLLAKLLTAKTPSVRAAAVRVVGYWLDRLDNAPAILGERVRDDNPLVRMEAVRSLTKLSDPGAMEIALGALASPMDPFLDYALKLTARETSGQWLPRLRQTPVADKDMSAASRWVYALLAVETPEAAGLLLDLWKRELVSPKDIDPVLTAIARFGQPGDLRVIFDAVAKASPADEQAAREVRLLDALAEADRFRGARPTGDLVAPMKVLVTDGRAPIRLQAIRLAAQWKLAALRPEITAIATAEMASGPDRAAAIDGLGALGGGESVAVLASLASQPKQPGVRLHALSTLAGLDAPKAAVLAKPLLVAAKSAEESSPLWKAFLKQKSGPAALAAALDGATLVKPVALEGVQVANSSGQVVPDLLGAISKAGSLPDTTRDLTAGQMAALVRDVQQKGDPARGEQVYRREKLNCVKCHAIKGAGGAVGPDLTTIGASAPLDYLIESMLSPNKKVKENYHSMVVATSEGEVLTGIPVTKSDEELVLRTAENKTISVAVRDIETSKMGGSLMPAGLMDTVTGQEFIDLARYMSELGKPGPYGASQELIARHWSLLGPFTAEQASGIGKSLLDAGAKFHQSRSDWQSSLTTNAGWVYLREFALKPEFTTLFASCRIEVQKSGKARLALEPAGAATVWLDGQPLTPTRVADGEQMFDVELKAGVSRLLTRIDLKATPIKLKLRGFALDDKASFELGATDK